MRHGVLAAVEGTTQIYLLDRFPEIGGGFFEGGAGVPSRIVEQAVDSTEAAHRLVHQVGASRLAGHVSLDKSGLVASGHNLRRCGLAVRFFHVGENNLGPFFREHAGAFEADALCGAGDDDYFSFNSAFAHG